MHIQIAMGTHNGARFLRQQLESIAAQTHDDWSLWVSDDYSSDNTREIVEEFARSVPQRVNLVDGPGRGVAANFIFLLNHPELDLHPTALADQDDVWLPDKLERAVASLKQRRDHGSPTLICGATRVVGKDLEPLKQPATRLRQPSFRNALVETIAGGNTMVLDPVLLSLVRRVGTDIEVPFHDWWLYLFATAVGAEIVYDETPLLLYRQHCGNTRGFKRGRQARLKRARELMDGTYRNWFAQNLAALSAVDCEMIGEARAACKANTKQVETKSRVRSRRLFIAQLAKRQSWIETLVIRTCFVVGLI